MSHIEQFEVWIPNDATEGHQVQARIVGLMEQQGWPMRDVFGVRLALEEAIVNAMTMAATMDGRNSHVVHGIPLDRLTDVMRRYGRLEERRP